MERKRSKYYLFYLKSSGKIYAYTDNKTYAEIFSSMRDEKLFFYKKEKLTSDEIKDLEEEASEKMMILYEFPLKDKKITFPITKHEKMNVEHFVLQAISVDMYLIAELIDPNIFQENVRDALNTLEWGSCYNTFHRVKCELENDRIKPDFLQCFLRLFGETMKER